MIALWSDGGSETDKRGEFGDIDGICAASEGGGENGGELGGDDGSSKGSGVECKPRVKVPLETAWTRTRGASHSS
jgi:hypothetical protein